MDEKGIRSRCTNLVLFIRTFNHTLDIAGTTYEANVLVFGIWELKTRKLG